MRRLPVAVVVLSAMFVCARAASASPKATIEPPMNGVSTTTGGGTTLSMATFTGAEYGVAKELVYYSDSYYNDYKVSELDWPLEPMLLGGAQFSLDAPSGLVTTLNVTSGLPTKVGRITDSDYLNRDGVRTHFSEHTATLEHSLSARIDLGGRAQVGPSFTVVAFGRYLYRNTKWTATDGYLQYPPQNGPPYTPWSSSTPKTYLQGLVAVYQQIYSVAAVGLMGEYRVNDQLLVKGSFAYSPIASANDIDNHVLRSLIFYDTVSNATYLEPSLSIAFKPTSSFTLTLDLSSLNIVSAKNGTATTVDTTTGSISTTAGSGSTVGMSLQTFSAALGVRLAF